MSVNKNKRIILKSNLKSGKNYAERGDQTEENIISLAIMNNNGNSNTTNSGQNLKEFKNLEDMNNELNSLKYQYESEKLDTTKKIKIYNEELNEKSRQLKYLTKDNFKLIGKLKDIGKNLKGDFLKSYKEIMKKRNISNKTEENLKNDIIIREEEIKNLKKFANAEKREKERYEKILNEVDNGMEQNIINELKELNDEIKQLQEEILELYLIKSKHKYCSKDIQNLQSKLNLYITEQEFESKKNKMLINQSFKSPKKANLSYTESNSSIYKNQNDDIFTKKLKYGQRISKSILVKNIPKPEKLNIFTHRYINSNINLLNKTPSKKINLHNISNQSFNLFTEGEFDFLQEVIPSKYMNKYLEEFESKKRETEEIKNKFEEHNIIKDQKQQIQLKIDYVEIKLKEEEKKHLELLVKFRNNNKMLQDLKVSIKKYEKKIKDTNKIIAREEKMHKIYSGQKIKIQDK